MEDILAKALEVAPEMTGVAIIVWMFLRHLTRYSNKCNEDLSNVASRYHTREGVIIDIVRENTSAMVELTDAVRTTKGMQYADNRVVPSPRRTAQGKTE